MTYTTNEAVEKMGVTRPSFSRIARRLNWQPVRAGNGRGNQSLWKKLDIDGYVNARRILKGHQS